jgi:hypothetical protein
MRIRSLCLSPEAADPPAQKPRVTSAETFIARYGTAEAAVAVLLQDLDASQRTAEAHSRALEEAKKQIPGAEKVVLEKKDADELAAYRALNLAPEKVTAVLTERDTLKGEVAKAALERLAKDAAAAAKLDPDAFAAHAATKGLYIELRDGTVTENGKPVQKKIPHVRPAADDKAPLVALSEYTGKLPAYEQRALAAAPSAPAGVPYLAQEPSSHGTPGSPAEAYLSKRFAPRQPAAAAAS